MFMVGKPRPKRGTQTIESPLRSVGFTPPNPGRFAQYHPFPSPQRQEEVGRTTTPYELSQVLEMQFQLASMALLAGRQAQE